MRIPLFASFAAFLSCFATAEAYAVSADFGGSPVSNRELSTIRGGYLVAGGLMIDFTINTKTLIDGAIMRDLQIASTVDTQQSVDIAGLKQVIQVGQNNSAIPQDLIDKLPALATIIQNSVDNKVIQNVNTLDINVHNTAIFQNNNLSSMINNGTIHSLH